MKLRPVLFVILLLTAFYYATTHLASTGALAPWLNTLHGQAAPAVNIDAIRGPSGNFDLSEASAAPAFDAEEQQNIAVYKKALPSVVNITSTAVAYDFFLRAVPEQGQGSGFIVDKEGHILSNNHVIDHAHLCAGT